MSSFLSSRFNRAGIVSRTGPHPGALFVTSFGKKVAALRLTQHSSPPWAMSFITTGTLFERTLVKRITAAQLMPDD